MNQNTECSNNSGIFANFYSYKISTVNTNTGAMNKVYISNIISKKFYIYTVYIFYLSYISQYHVTNDFHMLMFQSTLHKYHCNLWILQNYSFEKFG